MSLRRRLGNQHGLSLPDLLVASSLFIGLSAMVLGTVQFQGTFHRRELARSVAYSDARTALQQMVRELRLAGSDPLETGSFGVAIHKQDEIWFTFDADRNGAVDPGTTETRAYRFSGGTLWRWTGGTSWRPAVTGLANFGFAYRNARGDLIAESSTEKAAVIEISLAPPSIPPPPTESILLRNQ